MKVVMFMAMSINGLIADKNHSEAFLNDTWQYLVELGRQCGCIIWGRTTYELVNRMPPKYTKSIKNIKKVVISSNSQLPIKSNDQLFTDPQSAVRELKEQGYRKVLLSGGSRNNSSFAKLNLIDEIILAVDSIVVGKGVPLFFPEDFQLKLVPLRPEIRDGHLIYLQYKVVKS